MVACNLAPPSRSSRGQVTQRMSDFKFACPLCGQKILCDDQLAGQGFVCPSCKGGIVIPEARSQPVATIVAPATPVATIVPPATPVLRTAAPHVAASPPPPPPQAPHFHMPRPAAPAPASQGGGKGKPILIGAIALVVVGAGLYFGIPMVNRMQSKLNTATDKAGRESDGGQIGHIGDLYNVLEATDVSRDPPRRAPSASSSRKMEAYVDPVVAARAELEKAPVIAPSWTLEVGKAAVPAGRVNGTISGTNFLANLIRLDRTIGAYILSFRQGTSLPPDREMVVVLRLKPGERLESRTWTVSKDDRTGAPQVTKKWKANPRYAPLQKGFSSGYAMKLEFGKMGDGLLPGNIYLALPDPEKTVIAGKFNAEFDFDTLESPMAEQ